MSENKNSQDLVLSVRGAKLAKRVGATTVGELALFTADELLTTACFGETSLREVMEKLAERGLRLGMTPEQVRGRPGTQVRIVTQGKSAANQPAHEPEHEGPCCGHCEAAARKLRERVDDLKGKSPMSTGEPERLTDSQRKEIFQALVSTQDRGGWSVSESVRHVARQYGISKVQLRKIEEEGIDKEWPPLGQGRSFVGENV